MLIMCGLAIDMLDLPPFDIRIGYIPDSYPILCYTISAVSVVGLLLICKAIKWLPLVSYCGRYSIIILVTHVIVQYPLSIILNHTCFFSNLFLRAIFIAVITVIICWLLIPILRRFAPKLVAQKEFIHI